MAVKKNVEVQDHEGNIYYPHTAAKVVFLENGMSLEEQSTKMATEIESVKQSGVNAKSKMVTSINSKTSVPDVTESDTWDTLAQRVAAIKEGINPTGNAQPADVVLGKTFVNVSGEQTGTVPINPNHISNVYNHIESAEAVVGSSSNDGLRRLYMRAGLAMERQVIESDSWITTPVPDLVPENILAGKNILGIQGNIPIIADGSPSTNMHVYGPNVSPYNVYIKVPQGYYSGTTWLGYNEPDLKAENIRKGVQIGNEFNIIGTLESKKYKLESNITLYGGAYTRIECGFTPKCVAVKSQDESFSGFISSGIGDKGNDFDIRYFSTSTYVEIKFKTSALEKRCIVEIFG